MWVGPAYTGGLSTGPKTPEGRQRGIARCQADPRLNFYAAPMQTQSEPARIPTCRGSFLRVRRAPMLGMALLIGFAFVCLVIVHDRLTNRL
jgi:hypothetical protein